MLPKPLPGLLLLLLLAATCLPGCATAPSEQVAVIGCALLTQHRYTPEEQRRLADEIDAAPAAAIWPDFVADYGALRAEVAACARAR